MPVSLPNTATTDSYQGVQLGGSAEYANGSLTIANNPVSIIIERGLRGVFSSDEYPYVPPTTMALSGIGPSQWIVGIQIKSAIPGSPAQVSGWLVEPGVGGLSPGTPYTQQIAPGGMVNATGVIAGNFNSDGSVVYGSQINCTRTSTGVYVLTWSAGLFSVPPALSVMPTSAPAFFFLTSGNPSGFTVNFTSDVAGSTPVNRSFVVTVNPIT